MEGFPWDDLRTFCTEIKAWLRYKMAKNIVESFNPLSKCMNVTDDRQIAKPERNVVTFG